MPTKGPYTIFVVVIDATSASVSFTKKTTHHIDNPNVQTSDTAPYNSQNSKATRRHYDKEQKTEMRNIKTQTWTPTARISGARDCHQQH